MGRFTILDDPKVDEQIESQLSVVVDVIVDVLKDNLISIILFGGFGRGEGSITYSDNGRVLPRKDYDMLIIVKNKPDIQVVNQIYRMAYSNLGFHNPEEDLFRFSDFVLDFTIMTKPEIVRFPDISTYEIKTASSLLYGLDVRDEIPWSINDIPLTCGWRLLFEKLTGLLGHFPKGYISNGNISPKNKDLLFYECNKTYVEIGTCLCLLMGCYVPSFSKRNELFAKNFETMLPQLHHQLPNLPELVSRSTDFKLRSSFENIPENPLDLWFKVQNDLITVSQFYLGKLLDLKINNFAESHKAIKSKLKKKYLEITLSVISKEKLKTNSYLTRSFLSPALHFFINLRYFKGFYAKQRQFFFGLVTSPFTAVTINLHVVAPLILLSIKKDGEIVESYFELAKTVLKKLYPNRRIQSFEDLRELYLLTYTHLTLH